MPIPFVEERFDSDISYGSKGGPGFKTSVYESASGHEQRNKDWQYARCRYDVSHGIRDKSDMDLILNFFYVMGGRATGFRYKDWADYQLEREQIGLGDGSETTFQITKTYAVGAQSYVRQIRKIVEPDAGPPAIVFEVWVNNALVDPADYTINYNTGVIVFDVAPAGGHEIEVTCEFDVPVRFDTDEMEITQEAWELETWDSIPLIEIKPTS